MGISSKVAITLVVLIVGSLAVGIVGSEFGQGQYLLGGIRDTRVRS